MAPIKIQAPGCEAREQRFRPSAVRFQEAISCLLFGEVLNKRVCRSQASNGKQMLVEGPGDICFGNTKGDRVCEKVLNGRSLIVPRQVAKELVVPQMAAASSGVSDCGIGSRQQSCGPPPLVVWNCCSHLWGNLHSPKAGSYAKFSCISFLTGRIPSLSRWGSSVYASVTELPSLDGQLQGTDS